MSFDNLLGLSLENAREKLDSQTKIEVVRTSPPFHPRGYTPHWGAERVLRVRTLEEGRVELLVGRELVGEERAGKGASSG